MQFLIPPGHCRNTSLWRQCLDHEKKQGAPSCKLGITRRRFLKWAAGGAAVVASMHQGGPLSFISNSASKAQTWFQAAPGAF
jgi:hypothetical protein